MKVELELSKFEVQVRDDAAGHQLRKFSVSLDSAYGPHVDDVKSSTGVGMEWFNCKLAGMVYSGDSDEAAVLVEFDNQGRVKRVAVRADLQEKIETL